MKRAMERAEALAAFDALHDLFRGAFERFEVSGSLRRGRQMVNDLEIVCTPRFEVAAENLFGEMAEGFDHLEARIAQLVQDGQIAQAEPFETRAAPWGPRFKQLVIGRVPVDLFIVREPAQWGRIMATRTGPEELSKALVTPRPHGLKPMGIDAKSIQGALATLGGSLIPTPTEQDYFDVLQVPYIEPEDRDRWAALLGRIAA